MVGSSGEELIRLEKKEEGFPEDFPSEIYVNTNTNHKVWIDYYLAMLRNWLQNPQEFKKDFDNTDSDIPHLGPFREVPGDYTTSQTPEDEESTWEKGLRAWDVLASDPKMVKKTNHYIQNVLKLGYSINRRAHNATDSEQWPRLHDENNDIDVRLSDIGVGIAQIIPVVVGALDDSHSSGIFAVEQPELHVHPAVQVALGDVFIDGIKSSDYPTTQEVFDRCFSRIENSNILADIVAVLKEILERKEYSDHSAVRATLDSILDIIKKEPDIEAMLDRFIGSIRDSDPPVQETFKGLFKIKEKYDRDVQVAIKEFTRELLDSATDSNRTKLIETHSEHLLLRLLRRVRETTEGKQTDHILTPDDLSVVYVRPTSAGVKFAPISVTDDGDFYAPWPEGFFDERVKELF